MITLKQTNSEYLLFIPATQKERARAIEGRRWDPERKCWVFPRTIRMFDTLIAEFGDDLSSIPITRPTSPDQKLPLAVAGQFTQNLQLENQILRDDLAKIRESLELINRTNGETKATEAQTLKSALAVQEAKLSETQRNLDLKSKEIEHVNTLLNEVQREAEQLRSQNIMLQAEAANRQVDIAQLSAQLQAMVVQHAVEASGKNGKFADIVKRIGLSDSFSVAIGRELERELRQRLKVEDRSMSLYDLIIQASDAGILTADGVDLAHFVRKQRNKMAHDGAELHTHYARMLLSLYSSALLWPELLE